MGFNSGFKVLKCYVSSNTLYLHRQRMRVASFEAIIQITVKTPVFCEIKCSPVV